MFPKEIKLPYCALWVSLINVLLYKLPFFSFIDDNIDQMSITK